MNLVIHELKYNFKALLFWCIGMSFLVAAGLMKYAGVSGASESMADILGAMPPAVSAILGIGGLNIATFRGYYGVIYLFIAIIAASHAATLGAAIVAKEQRDMTSEFLYVKPILRSQIISAKLFAAFLNLLTLNIVSYAVSVGVSRYLNEEGIYGDILNLMVAVFLIQLFFLAIGVFISIVLKNKAEASGISSAIVMLCYVFYVLCGLSDNLYFTAYFSPFKFFEASKILKNGLEFKYVAVSLAVFALCTLAAYLLHETEDISV